MYKTALGAFEQIDANLLRVARTLGASEVTIFWRITLPLAMPGILAGTTLAFARALGEFGATLMLAGNIPGQTQTIPMAIYFAVEAGAMNEAWVWVLVIMGISLSGIIAVNYWGSGIRDRGQGSGVRGQGLGKTSSLIPNPQQDDAGTRGRGDAGRNVSQFWSPGLAYQGSESPTESGDSVASIQMGLQSPSELSPCLPISASPCLFLESLPITNPQSPIPNSGLFVDIQKQLPGFLLDVSFSTNEQVLGLLGASGAGKSMILRCIAGIETPTKGRIVLNGRVLFDSEKGINIPSRDRHIGFLFQNYALFPHLSVAQNIAFGLPKGTSALTIKQQVEAQLAAMQLQGYADRYPRELSGGQQQRVALARALASQPEALLLDEPFSALDTHLRSQLEQQLITSVETYQGVTLFVTHNLEEAYRVCQDLLVMERGKAIAYSSKQNIFERPNTVSVAQLTGCKNFSRVVVKASQQIEAIDWGCTLRVIEPVSELLSHVGIRAHQLTFTNEPNQDNTFPCWVARTSETPHRMTLYLKLNVSPTSPQDYHLQAEVFKEKWAILKDQSFPWYIRLDPLRLMLME
jgi:molybdate transport system permease protein